MASDLRNPLTIGFAAVKIHAAVSVGRVPLQYRVIDHQWLDHREPIGVAYLAQTFHSPLEQGGVLWRVRIRIFYDAISLGDDLFQQQKFED